MKKFWTLLLWSAVCLPLAVSAHNTGRSFEKQIGNYLVDIGYNVETEIVAGEPVYFDYELYQREPAPGDAAYSDVWVRISQASTTLFATGIAHMTSGQTGMMYTFDRPGTYTMSVRYERGDTTLAETSFPLEVAPGGPASPSVPYPTLLIGAVILLCGTVFLLYKQRRARAIV